MLKLKAWKMLSNRLWAKAVCQDAFSATTTTNVIYCFTIKQVRKMTAISVCKYQENYIHFPQIKVSLWNYLNSQDLQGEHLDTNFNNWLITFHLCAYLLLTSPNFQSIYHFMFTSLKHGTLLDWDTLRCNSTGNIKFLSCYDTTLCWKVTAFSLDLHQV